MLWRREKSCTARNRIRANQPIGILHIILYGCETWSLALREEHRLMVFENRVLRRICRTHGDEDACVLGYGGEARSKETSWKT
jgi:hypothetical protein